MLPIKKDIYIRVGDTFCEEVLIPEREVKVSAIYGGSEAKIRTCTPHCLDLGQTTVLEIEGMTCPKNKADDLLDGVLEILDSYSVKVPWGDPTISETCVVSNSGRLVIPRDLSNRVYAGEIRSRSVFDKLPQLPGQIDLGSNKIIVAYQSYSCAFPLQKGDKVDIVSAGINNATVTRIEGFQKNYVVYLDKVAACANCQGLIEYAKEPLAELDVTTVYPKHGKLQLLLPADRTLKLPIPSTNCSVPKSIPTYTGCGCKKTKAPPKPSSQHYFYAVKERCGSKLVTVLEGDVYVTHGLI